MTVAATGRTPAATVPHTRLSGGRRKGDQGFTELATSPLISVVTVVYNAGAALRSTINSVLSVRIDRGDMEYIVVDGGSTDATITTLQSLDGQLDLWISEPDAGIYDAMNKGIELARGQWVYHLNIGDRMLCVPNVFDVAIPSDVECVSARVQIDSQACHLPSAGLELRFHNTLHHQGTFYRKTPRLHYDLRYKVFADFDLNQQLLLSGARIVLCDEIVASHDQGGVSHNRARFSEVYRVVRANFGPLWVVACFLYFKYRGLRKRLRLS